MVTIKKSAVFLASVGALSSVAAVPCTFGTGSCTAAPCPGTLLRTWLDCVEAPLGPTGMCPTDTCKLLPNADDPTGATLCVLPDATAESITTAQVNAAFLCFSAPSVACVLPLVTLLDSTGCTTCLDDLVELQPRNEVCTGATTEAACEAIDTPCPGEDTAPTGVVPSAMPPVIGGMAPLEDGSATDRALGPIMLFAPGPAGAMAPGPAGAMAPSPSALSPTGIDTEVDADGTTGAAAADDGTTSTESDLFDTTGGAATTVCGAVSAAAAIGVAMLL